MRNYGRKISRKAQKHIRHIAFHRYNEGESVIEIIKSIIVILYSIYTF